jgi:hypothetical protein
MSSVNAPRQELPSGILITYESAEPNDFLADAGYRQFGAKMRHLPKSCAILVKTRNITVCGAASR